MSTSSLADDNINSGEIKNIESKRTFNINPNHSKSVDPLISMEITYDRTEVDRFLDVVFHDLLEDEHIAMWEVNPLREGDMVLGFPKEEQELLDKVFDGKFDHPRALYFGTSTVKKADDGRVYHGNEHFYKLRVIVLDDIGTKGKPLPEGFKPTYIIESSPNNYQYGYVLSEPVDNVAAAKLLVQKVFTAGYSDAGGSVAVKAVRLPAGVNGKDALKYGDDYRKFKVRLVELNEDILYSPQEILDWLSITVRWNDVLSDADAVARMTATDTTAGAQWGRVKSPSLDGTVDQVLEWLIETNRIKNDTGLWVTVDCPNAHEHTNGNPDAGYRPLGRGKEPTTRAFKCHHGHCSNIKTSDYLAYLAELNCPKVPVRDDAANLTSKFVYDMSNDAVWEVYGRKNPTMFKMSAFNNRFNKPVQIVNAKGKVAHPTQAKLFMSSEGRVVVDGPTADPTTEARIVEKAGKLYVNTVIRPSWGHGKIEQYHVDKFLDYLDYLIPDDEEREYFLDWLSAKAQNFGFRGAAIVMVAVTQGVGRSTLGYMIRVLFGEENAPTLPFTEIISGNQFNEWQTHPWVICDETLNVGENRNAYYRAYEALKDVVDPRPKTVFINQKYRAKFTALCCTTFLMFSNHTQALSISADDRRFYVVRNPDIPAPKEFFEDVNAWLDEVDSNGNPKWAASVWRWLQNRSPNMSVLMAPPTHTESKMSMLEGGSPLEAVVRAALRAWPIPFITTNAIKAIADTFKLRLDLDRIPNIDSVLTKIIQQETIQVPSVHNLTMTIAGKKQRIRYIRGRIDIRDLPEDMSGPERAVLIESINNAFNNKQVVIDEVSDALDLLDL